jgi:hypothetical protein
MRHTADTSHDRPTDTSHDRPTNTSRYTVPEAAQALGISPEAVRNRLSRGTLDSVKENGSVFVLLDADKVRYTDGTPTDRPQHTGGTPSDISEDSGALIASKDETIRVLLSQLEAERAASAEMRRIVAGLVQRVPELEPAREASPEATGGPVTPSDHEGNGTGRTDEETSEKPSWWRRFLGVE